MSDYPDDVVERVGRALYPEFANRYGDQRYNYDAATPNERGFCLLIAKVALAAAWEWRPIESVPKDGSFLIGGGGRMSIASGTILHIANLPDTPKHLSLHWATKWMPLPPPPKTE